MVETAFVMVNFGKPNDKDGTTYKDRTDEDVVADIEKVPGVAYVKPVFGEYDAIVKVEGEGLCAISRTVVEGIRTIKGVVDTNTLIAYRFPKSE